MAPASTSNRTTRPTVNTTVTPTAPKPLNSRQPNRDKSALPIILDADNVDRTPQPLYVSSYSSLPRGTDAVGGLKVGTDDGTKFPLDTTPLPLCSTSPAPPAVTLTLPKPPVAAPAEPAGEVEEEEKHKHKHRSHQSHSSAKAASSAASQVSGKSVDEEYVITLTESPTFFLVGISGTQMAQDAPNYNAIKLRNEAYQKVLNGRDHADNLHERHAQTINFAQKTKSVQAVPCTTSSVGCQSTDWDIHDAYVGGEGEDEDAGNKLHEVEVGGVEKLVKTVTSALEAKDCLLDINEASNSDVQASSKSVGADDYDYDDGEEKEEEEKETNAEMIMKKKKNLNIMSSTELLKSLNLMERAVQQNLYHDSHLRYRNYPSGEEGTIVPEDSDSGEEKGEEEGGEEGENGGEEAKLLKSKDGASMSKLFTFQCELSKGRTATTMSWNRGNKDILAVGYGSFHLSDQEKDGGLVMFWSIRNPAHPEKIIRTVSGVTAIDFSTAHPNMLAVGMYNGTVAIYDMRKEKDFNVPVLESGSMSSKHMEPVWEVKWVDKGVERGESLVTIATDGRVLEWNMKKGLSLTELMVLKRIGNSDGVISRQASGLCLDFPLNDSSVYLTGTEDGHIHRCSCSYNEQYLDTYSGHSGPVYKLRCSPFLPEAFLSCSADWTVKLWNSEDTEYIYDFHSTDLSEVVNDIVWSPSMGTVFASVTGDGRVEVWDLEYSVIDPKLYYRPSKAETVLGVTPLTTARFSDNAPVLATGDAKGKVEIFRLEGMEVGENVDAAEQRSKLLKLMEVDEEV